MKSLQLPFLMGKGVSQACPHPAAAALAPFFPGGMGRAGVRGARHCQRLMINPAPRVPSAILIRAGGRLQPLAPRPPRRDPVVPAAVPLRSPGRASPRWAATVQHGAGVGAVSPLPASPLLASLMPQGPVLGLRPSEGGGEMKAASPLLYFHTTPWQSGIHSGR